jgi:L-ascorbate metabolism protein UlaG (beta-lactamase superfamily)
MKITKLVHSCMIVEKDGKKALVDPGSFSWESRIPQQEMLRDIDYVIVTHAHPDHIDPTFASVVNEMSPNAIWYVTPSTKEVIEALPGVQIELESSLDDVVYIASEHADLKHWGACEDHSSYLLFGELLIGGDCRTLTSMNGATVFAGANGGPWGSIKGMLNMLAALDDKPAKFIPLHDWHWNDQTRKNFYTGLVEAMNKLGIEFIPVENGIEIEV